MISSVRGRLTVAVAVVTGGLVVGLALTAPKAVHNSLIDDRLDAEVDSARAALGIEVVNLSDRSDDDLGAAQLTALFGPQVADLAGALDGTGALAELREFDTDGRIFVSPVRNVVATIDRDGTIRVDRVEQVGRPGPIVTTYHLEQLRAQLRGAEMFEGPLDMLRDEDGLSIDEFIARLDDEFGSNFGDRLDRSVFDRITDLDLGDELIPPDVFELIDDLFPAPPDQPAAAAAMPAVEVSELAFGVRGVDGVDVIVSSSTDGIDRTVDRLQGALWAAVPVAILLGGGITWLLAGRALRPVGVITDRTRQIRSTTLHERVPVPEAGDELTELAMEMNTMLDRVQREDERRRQFVADASHELRSPLAAIRTQAEAALAETGGDHELAAGILAEAERMSTLVDDLLSLARHDEALAPPGVPVDLDDVVLTEASRPRRVAVDVKAVSAGQVRGRADELTRVVAHLLDNAARHAESKVAVGLESVGDHVMLSVDDDGPGVPLEHRDRIFERFVRLDEARERDRGGAGLGLAVVASVVEAGGGDVTVTDSEQHGGARFTIVLPAAD